MNNKNYKIKITPENQAIVKRIADENNMNPRNFYFNEFNWHYIIEENKFWSNDEESDYPELTTEQFIELFDKKETELEKWLRETKAENLNRLGIESKIRRTNDIVFNGLKGDNPIEKSEILFNQWNNKTEETPIVETEWQPKRGDRVLVWDNNEKLAEERIFLAEIKGAIFPIVTVGIGCEDDFKEEIEFETTEYKHMKPLPTEPIQEIDYKAKFEKVIELIDKRIETCNKLMLEAANRSDYQEALIWRYSKSEAQEILKQINELQ